MSKQGKITWEVIFKDFKVRYSKMAERAYDYEAYGYATILIKFPEGVRRLYNYDTKEVRTLLNNEIETWEKKKRGIRS